MIHGIINNLGVSNINPSGSATGSYTEGTRSYNSTKDAVTGCQYDYSYDDGFTKQVIVVIIPGWGGDKDNIDQATKRRWAERGGFCIAVSMRGRDGASGSRDASAIELHDIYDAILDVRSNFASKVHKKVLIVGYSGGGGNALGLCSKFPDLSVVNASFFGMSDYGYDGTDGWYYNNGGAYTAQIVTAVGDTPANTPNNYRARYMIESVAGNYTGGFLYMYHSPTDSIVPVVHSTNVKDAFDGASKTNYSYNVSTDYAHNYPQGNANLITVEPTIWAKVLTQEVWTIAVSGSIKVTGYIITKRFTIWLDSGYDGVADVVYNVNANSYTVTPLTGNMTVNITQGSKSGSAVISGQTTITVA